jgi:hypothetical protein
MSAQELCCALPVLTGPTTSQHTHFHTLYPLTIFRIKEKLRSGEMVVSGDQWPVFLYNGYNYDPEDPWNGLFRSSLLVSASLKLCSRYIK